MTAVAIPRVRPAARAFAAALGTIAVLGAAPVTAAADQVTLSSTVQGAVYPDEPRLRSAGDGDMRGAIGIEIERHLSPAFGVRADLVGYGSSRRRTVFDGEAAASWRAGGIELTGGMLRESWGRFTNSALDVIGVSNTPFSLVAPQQALAQPAAKLSTVVNGVVIDAYALGGRRTQSLPESDGRFGFGLPTRNVVTRGRLGDAAVAVRLSGTARGFDWSGHAFRGGSRRPTFVPSFDVVRGPDVAATYTDLFQVGGDLETTRADWRLEGEGFVRDGGIDVTGRERRYGYAAAAAEYQRFGAFDGAWNLIPRFELTADSRGERADIPFASSIRAGMRVAATQQRPLTVDVGWLFDYAVHGHGVMASMEKPLAESPGLSIGVRATAFAAGTRPSVLDVWRDDLEIYSFLRVELSR